METGRVGRREKSNERRYFQLMEPEDVKVLRAKSKQVVQRVFCFVSELRKRGNTLLELPTSRLLTADVFYRANMCSD